MNKIMPLIAVIITSGLILSCSESSKSLGDQSQSPSSPDKTVDISNLDIDSVSVLPDNLFFGTASASVELTKTVTIKNNNTIAKPLSISLAAAPGFKIKINRCPSSLSPRKSCDITLSFSSRDLFNNNYNTSLEINGTALPLTATVTGKPNPDTSGTPEILISLDAPFLPSSSATRVLTLENIGDGTLKDLEPALTPEYGVRINRCPSDLRPEEECTMQIFYKDNRSSNTPPEVPIGVSSSNLVIPSVNSATGEVISLESYLNGWAQAIAYWFNDGSSNSSTLNSSGGIQYVGTRANMDLGMLGQVINGDFTLKYKVVVGSGMVSKIYFGITQQALDVNSVFSSRMSYLRGSSHFMNIQITNGTHVSGSFIGNFNEVALNTPLASTAISAGTYDIKFKRVGSIISYRITGPSVDYSGEARSWSGGVYPFIFFSAAGTLNLIETTLIN